MSSAPVTTSPRDVPEEQLRRDEPSIWPVQTWWRRAQELAARTDTSWLPAAAQLFSGLLFGIMLGVVLGWTAVSTVAVALLCAGLSWLGRGLASLLVAIVVTLSTLAAVFRVTMLVGSPIWDLRWLEPLAILGTAGILWGVRRLGAAGWSRQGMASVVLEVLSGVASLAAGWGCVHRTASNLASSILLSSEDNSAWLNVVQHAKTSSGVSAVTVVPAKAYGPVVDVLMAFVRSGTRGPVPKTVAASHTADAVLAAHLLLIASAPIIAAVLVRRTTQYRRPLLTALAWFTVTAALEFYNLTLPVYGFLTGGLALLMLVLVCSLVPPLRLNAGRPRPVFAWLAAAALLYGAGASWLPLIPLGVLALLVWYAAVALPALALGPWVRVRAAILLGLPILGCVAALYAQYHDVVGPLGGGSNLYNMGGGTPSTTDVLTATAAAIVLGMPFVHGIGQAGRTRRRSVRAPLGWLATYVIFLTLLNGWETKAPPQYGSIKLLYLSVGAIVALGVAELFASPVVGRRSINVAATLLVATLFVNVVESGPAYAAATAHWPLPGPAYKWIPPIDQLVTAPGRIMCINPSPVADLSQDPLQAYICTRWVSSLQGLDDAVSTTWRNVQIGRAPIKQAVADANNAKDKPWRILVIGSKKQFDNPKAWWSPLNHLHGMKYIYMY